MFELTATNIAFIVLVVTGIAVTVFGKIRMNTTLMVVGGIAILAGLYCILSGMFMVQQ